MPGCAAVGCTNSSEKGFSMRKFPKDPDRRNEWAMRTNRKHWFPTDSAVLCEIHFAPEMWEKVREDGKKRLKFNAIPTLFSFPKIQKPKKRADDKRLAFAEPEVIILELENEGKSESSPSPSETSSKVHQTSSISPNSGGREVTTPADVTRPHESVDVIENEHSYANLNTSTDTSALQVIVDITKLSSNVTNVITSSENSESKFEKLRNNKELIAFRKLLQKKKFLLSKYKNKLRNANRKIKMLEQKINNNEQQSSSEEAMILRQLFEEDQIKALKKQHKNVSTKFMKWSDKTLMKSLQLRYRCGAAGYEALIKQNFPYPSIRTLQRKLRSIVFDSPVPPEVAEFLESNITSPSQMDSDCEKK